MSRRRRKKKLVKEAAKEKLVKEAAEKKVKEAGKNLSRRPPKKTCQGGLHIANK